MPMPDGSRRCPSCGSRLRAGLPQCPICGHGVPWRWTRRGVLLESALVVALVAVLGLTLAWLRSTGRAFVSPAERVAELALIERPPTEMPTFTPEPGPPAAGAAKTAAPDVADATGAPGAVEHTVGAGETLSGIAAMYGVAPQAIIVLNELERPKALGVGQTLRVPDGAGVSRDVSGPADEQVGPTDGGGVAPDVAEGETVVEVSDGSAAPVSAAGPADDVALVLREPATVGEPIVVTEAQTHTIKAGDTLGGVAARYGVPLDELLRLNAEWLTSVSQTLQVGDQVVVQSAVMVTATPEPHQTPVLAAPAAVAGAPGASQVMPYESAAGVQYRAPTVLSPGPGAVVTTDSVLLRWTSVGVLPRGVAYVVSIRDADAPESEAVFEWVTTNATSLRLSSAYRPALGASRRVAWTVDVRRRGGRVVEREGTPLSPPAKPSEFSWSPG